jgi:GNAT superfamily N-acetyltransferase
LTDAGGGAGKGGHVTVRDASTEDVPLLLELFAELAVYEHLESELHATEALLGEALFGERPAARALIGECDSRPAGYAVYFPTFSSFLARPGVWLEDVFVRPEHRGAGVGRALLAAVAAAAHGYGGRLEWTALHWNELALGFYEGLGAVTMDEWITHRLVGEPLSRLAEEAPGGAPTEPVERR